MSDRACVFHEDDAAAVEEALAVMASGLRREVEDLRSVLKPVLAGWSLESDSRAAQVEFDERMGDRAEELASALDRAAQAMSRVRELAHDAEARNVAVVD